jgi:hexosaminidase
LTTGTSPLVIDTDTFSIDISEIQSPPDDLEAAVSRTRDLLFNDKLERLVLGRGASDQPLLEAAPPLKSLKLSLYNGNDSTDEEDAKGTPGCKVVVEGDGGRAPEVRGICAAQQVQDNRRRGAVKGIAEETALPVEERDESYTLKIPSDGSEATLAANTTLGLLRGLTTFGQVWYQFEDSIYTVEAPFEVTDSPYYVSWA